MVDFALEEHEKNKVAAPAALKTKRTDLVAEHKTLSAKTQELRKILDDAELMGKLKAGNNFNFEFLAANHGVTRQGLTDLFAFARFQFGAGNYGQAGQYLAVFRALAGEGEVNLMGALWGKLAADILLQDWSVAQDDLVRLKEAIESGAGANEDPALKLMYRTWLLHWSLFVYFAQPDGLNRFIDLAMNDAYTNAVQTTSPHLLRYMAVAHVVSNQRRFPLRELVRVVEQEKSNYGDAVTKFLLSLYVDFDFEAAQTHLKAAQTLLQGDYFLRDLVKPFLDNARVLLFRSYCRIHQSIDLGLLSTKLDMNAADAESYIVNLIRNEQEAKIDSAKNQILFKPATSSIYQKLLERTQALSTQTALLQTQLEKKRNEV